MKIDNSIGSTGVPVAKENTTRTSGAPAGTPAATGGVQLSALSSQLQSVQANLATVPVVNQAHVDEIKQAISEGRFKVNPDVVADKLIATVRELIGNKSSS
jgi:negative regulator of flagellin synthesis FlgM